MVCPACNVVIHLSYTSLGVFVKNYQDFGLTQTGYKVVGGFCPSCGELIALLRKGECEYMPEEDGFSGEMSWQLNNEESEELIYPQITQKFLSDAIPENIKEEYIKAESLVKNNPSACIIACRTIVQFLLRTQYNINCKELGQEIYAFKGSCKGLPQILFNFIDYVRIFGNIAAHPESWNNEPLNEQEAIKILQITYALIEYTYLQALQINDIDKILKPKFSQWQNSRAQGELKE